MTTAHFLMIIRFAIRSLFAAAPVLVMGACLAASPTALFVDRDSGGPVPGVVVTLSAGTGSWQFETDAGGSATLSNLEPGIYRLRIEKPGYLDPAAPDAAGRFCPIASSAGKRLLIPLVRTVVMAGQVTDERGQPLSDMAVVAAKRVQGQGQLQFAMVGRPVLTDESGHYRLHSLPPGAYTVAVVPGVVATGSGAAGPVYYRGQSDPSRAEFVDLAGGAEVSGVDISVSSETPGSIAGAVTGIPAQWQGRRAAVAIVSRFGSRLLVATGSTDPEGKYLLESIAPGEYYALAWGVAEGSDFSIPPHGPQARFAAMPVSVRSGERTEIDLAMSPGITVEARIVATPGTGGSCGAVESLRIRPEGEWPDSWTFPGRQTKDGVVWENLPAGTHRFEIPGLQPPCTFLGVRTAGRDEAPRPVITLPSATRLSVAIGSASGGMSGKLHVKGKPVKGVRVGLWALDERGGAVETATDEKGAFQFDRLPPGRYHLLPLDVPGLGANPGRRFSLENAQRIEIDLNLNKDE
jgi:protocatechuate 3,4-dioxygenase beta subunit